MALPARKRLSYAEYLVAEREADTRHEFLDGEIRAMSGGTPRHSAIKVNLTQAVSNALGRGPCRTYDSDLKIRVLDSGLATYPDLAVVCGPLELDPDDRNAVANPIALFEVLSEGTEAWDRGDKFAHYRRIATLKHYVLVDWRRPRIEHYVRGDGTWILSEHGAGDVVRIEAIGCVLAVDEVFRDLPEG